MKTVQVLCEVHIKESLRDQSVKRIATSAIILVQLWMLAPVCCCWFNAVAASWAAIPARRDCCSQSDPGAPGQNSASPEKDRNCRCSESKIELPPMTVVISDLTSLRLALEQLLLVPAQVAVSVVAEPSGPQDFLERPPPLSVADRLSSLHRLNL